MRPSVTTRDPAAVQFEVQQAFLDMFPGADRLFIPRIFGWAVEFFTGGFRDYQAVDASYHDFEHTLQGTLCMARLLHGRHGIGASPVLSLRAVKLGLLAMLLHDTGYLKKRDDNIGTGAKYTATHVERSGVFAGELLAEKGFPPEDVRAVQNMIYCTGVNANLAAISFQSEEERIAGYALGTADYLGQMAAEDYVEKLPTLYEEFAEAEEFAEVMHYPSAGGVRFIAGFKSPDDLLRKTPGFWQNFVKPKLENDFLGLYQFLNDPYPDGPNPYLQLVEANIARVKKIIDGGY